VTEREVGRKLPTSLQQQASNRKDSWQRTQCTQGIRFSCTSWTIVPLQQDCH